MKKIDRPNREDAPSWCPYFLDLATEDDLMEALQNNKKHTLDLIASIPFSREDYTYAEDRWPVKKIFIHLVDTERFYAYKAFCASRKVAVDLDFDPGEYARHMNDGNRWLEDIGEEFLAVRESTIHLFRYMTTDMLDHKGFPDRPGYTARCLGWMAVGHTIHHCNIIQEKYHPAVKTGSVILR